MVLKLYNTLTNNLEVFKPLKKGFAGFYPCGPTVNNYIHIGHARTYTFWDVVKRYLEYSGYKVRLVSNITDIAIDDKILKEVKKAGISFQELITKYTMAYFEDRLKLGLALPDVNCLATQHIQEMTELIEKLLKKGYAYETSDGVYFNISKFKDYGRLSGMKPKELKAGAGKRVKEDEYEKGVAGDFALWKKHKRGEPYWHSPWGKGRPGWHIECSAMSMKYLGETFDIHGGGQDNIFPHHENELAQSEAATGKKFVNYWMHPNLVLMNGEKMSKSKGNFITVRDAAEKYSGLLLRFFYLNTHYRKKIDFNGKDIQAVKLKLNRITEAVRRIKTFSGQGIVAGIPETALLKTLQRVEKNFEDAMDDDFNTSLAITRILELVKEINKHFAEHHGISPKTAGKIFNFMEKTGRIFFGDLFESEILKKEGLNSLSEQLLELIIKLRDEAREKKDYNKSDYIRNELKKNGVILNDNDKTTWSLE
ncbi:cysteine--tRNA ligase [archaeon CG_4_10_14_0_2_um_filter_Archaea_38_6]|nr:MAG: cysteine--tRNA ligase [archaeon CG07_land_8_20_14_0_80_38_8]PIU89217.1 MAG: cysteine--tRNA ligase [archaeon CG06_land_8_20_14_3_00_37_11]PJA21842.1 MAG: cysteine--tRNA ligase [archaeon CG_4_10_14_0_2_um_filter_Archaea_38_6]